MYSGISSDIILVNRSDVTSEDILFAIEFDILCCLLFLNMYIYNVPCNIIFNIHCDNLL